jgi:hypothetical protein
LCENSIRCATENGGGRADAESEREDVDGGETRIFAELAEAIAAIEESEMEPVTHAFAANLFFYLFDAAKFHMRAALRFVRGACRHECFRRSTLRDGNELHGRDPRRRFETKKDSAGSF